MRSENFHDGIFLVAGAYLIYLAYQMFTDTSEEGGNEIVRVVFAIAFLVIGILVMIRSIYGFWKSHGTNNNSDGNDDADDTVNSDGNHDADDAVNSDRMDDADDAADSDMDHDADNDNKNDTD